MIKSISSLTSQYNSFFTFNRWDVDAEILFKENNLQKKTSPFERKVTHDGPLQLQNDSIPWSSTCFGLPSPSGSSGWGCLWNPLRKPCEVSSIILWNLLPLAQEAVKNEWEFEKGPSAAEHRTQISGRVQKHREQAILIRALWVSTGPEDHTSVYAYTHNKWAKQINKQTDI